MIVFIVIEKKKEEGKVWAQLFLTQNLDLFGI
jgi:hypothetical protein